LKNNKEDGKDFFFLGNIKMIFLFIDQRLIFLSMMLLNPHPKTTCGFFIVDTLTQWECFSVYFIKFELKKKKRQMQIRFGKYVYLFWDQILIGLNSFGINDGLFVVSLKSKNQKHPFIILFCALRFGVDFVLHFDGFDDWHALARMKIIPSNKCNVGNFFST
jgi:hypothetical protein